MIMSVAFWWWRHDYFFELIFFLRLDGWASFLLREARAADWDRCSCFVCSFFTTVVYWLPLFRFTTMRTCTTRRISCCCCVDMYVLFCYFLCGTRQFLVRLTHGFTTWLNDGFVAVSVLLRLLPVTLFSLIGLHLCFEVKILFLFSEFSLYFDETIEYKKFSNLD